jgi:hypothetical protein
LIKTAWTGPAESDSESADDNIAMGKQFFFLFCTVDVLNTFAGLAYLIRAIKQLPCQEVAIHYLSVLYILIGLGVQPGL